MCNYGCLWFVGDALAADDVAGKAVLEVGSRIVQRYGRYPIDIHGRTVDRPRLASRWIVEELEPASYLGLDIIEGEGVDAIVPAEEIVARFGSESFDVVIATELVEHTRDWRAVMRNLKDVVRPGGVLLVTTRSRGFPYHAYPYDYWRYEVEDMTQIFSDMTLERIERDPDRLEPGVFVLARKPDGFRAADLSQVPLYSIVAGKRVRELGWRDVARHRVLYSIRRFRKALLQPTKRLVKRLAAK